MKKRLFSIAYMFFLTLFFTSVVSAVKFFNEERIQRNENIKLQRIILRVLNVPVRKETSDEEVIEVFGNRIKSIELKGKTFYAAYASNGETITGYAFPVGGAGFWGPISGMVAVDPNGSKLIGLAFNKHSETPGLGARITEDWFTRQFKGLPLLPIEGDRKIFYLKLSGSKERPNELDAITGATGTSRAVETFLNEELDNFLKNFWGALKKV